MSHEAEVRGVTLERTITASPKNGLSIPFDNGRAIDAVVISPFAPAWFNDVVLDVIGKFGLTIPVVSFDLTAEPFY
jgi:hypothetical protein